MSTILNEINALMLKFESNERKDLIKYFIFTIIDRFEKIGTFNSKELILVLFSSNYIIKSSRRAFISHLMNTKILNTRALILDLIKYNYESNRWAFSKPEKWIENVIRDIKSTFMFKDYLDDLTNGEISFVSSNSLPSPIGNFDLFLENNITGDVRKESDDSSYTSFNINLLYEAIEIFNLKLINELSDIFLGKNLVFQRSGNQLLLNIIHYKAQLSFLNYPFDDFIKKISHHINKEERLEMGELDKIYKEYLSRKKKKKIL